MPTVGKKKFSYTKKGKAQANAYAKKKNKKVTNKKKY